jgi:Flp pilus assembly protein TadG
MLKTMGTIHTAWNRIFNHLRVRKTAIGVRSKGQAMVEFTLVFVLMLVVLWIPADFGLAFYTHQLALNASRDGARIAAAEKTLPALPATCTLPCTGAADILQRTAHRVSPALLPGATITLTQSGAVASCNAQLTMRVEGTYNFFWYKLLRLFGADASDDVPIVGQTKMRWEHQC